MQKTVLITGGARRIGATIATFLHEKGFRVIIHCNQSLDEALILKDKLNFKRKNSAFIISMNLDAESSAKELITESLNLVDRIDVLVNNASVFSANDADIDAMLLLNVKVPYWLSTWAFSYLKETGGCIVNITDTHASSPLRGYSLYCQTKAALLMQTKSLAMEFGPNVRVNAVAPGITIWPEGKNKLDENQQEKIISKTILNRHGDPIFIAKAVYFMIENNFITGQEIKVDGGRNL